MRFNSSVNRMFDFLKSSTNFHQATIKAIPLIDQEGFLLPLSQFHINDLRLVEQVNRWRSLHLSKVHSSGSSPNISDSKLWFQAHFLEAPTKMLFFIYNNNGEPVGHIGLQIAQGSQTSNLELCNLVQKNEPHHRNITKNAIQTLTQWSQEKFVSDSLVFCIHKNDVSNISILNELNYIENKINTLPSETLSFLPTPSNVTGSSMILTAGPSISPIEVSYAYDAALNGWNNQWSKYIKNFESSFAKYVGAKFALSTSCCTGALHLSLLALDIKAGDEVIVPDITWVATANAIKYVGATPIFADINPKTWCLDTDILESYITPSTKAILPVHLYGFPANMPKIMDIAKKYNLKVVEDAAPAIGATVNNQKVGTFGDIGCFSFQGAKLTVTGEGGMIVTNEEETYLKIRSLWDQGRNPNKTFWIDKLGWKYKMSNIQAALGLAQLERVDDLIAAKQRIFKWYYERLSELDCLDFETTQENSTSIYWMTSIQLNEKSKISRDELIVQLKKRNVDTRPVFPAISQYPIWGYNAKSQPVAIKVGNSAINLPSGVCLTEPEVDYVCRNIAQLVN